MWALHPSQELIQTMLITNKFAPTNTKFFGKLILILKIQWYFLKVSKI